MNPKSHESWKEELPAYLLGALSPAERADIEFHIGGCPECQAELRWLAPATERLAGQVEQTEPSAQLKSRLMAAVEADLAEHGSPETLASATGPEPSVERRGRFGFGRLLRPAAVAAVLFAGVVVGYALNGGDENQGEGPTVATQTLPGHSNVGNAKAVMVTSGDSGTLKVSNLPKLKDGDVYQAWVQKGQSVKPTDSLFTPRKNGTATTSIPDLSDVNTVMVSAEPRGGSDQPTTTPIITIDIPS